MSRLTTDSQIKKDLQKNNRTMEVTRIIHPVGQGGFYTETLSTGKQEATFVYDCGGFDNKTKMKIEEYLKSFLPKEKTKKRIEAVFISHLHADHINGLQYLLDNAEVKYLFLPQITEDIMIEAFVYNFYSTKQNNGINNFLLELYRGTAQFGSKERPTKIIQIGYPEDSRVPEEFSREIFSEDSLDLQAWDWRQRKVIDLSTVKILSANVMLHCYKWLYIPYNSKISDTSKLTKLRDELTKQFNTKVTIDNLPSLVKKYNVDTIKGIYEGVFGGKQNPTSMTLFSGTFECVMCERCKIASNCCHRNLFCEDFYRYQHCCNPNILYTGDFEPENNIADLNNFYSAVWKKFAMIQIPHHGSKNNYKDELYEYPVRGIVSVGNNNQSHHPDIDTLIKIRNQGCHPVIVTEDKSSMKIYHYSF